MHGSKPFVRAGKALSLVAILFATIGSHFAHLSFHHISAPSDGLAVVSSSQNSTKLVESKSADECPICKFLSHFLSHSHTPGRFPVLHDRVPQATVPVAFAALKDSFGQSHAPRAPPLSILS